MKDASIDQILSDLEEIKKLAERTLCEKEIREHCDNVWMELMDNVNDNQRR